MPAAPATGAAASTLTLLTASLPQWQQSFLATQTGTVRNIRARIKAAGHIQLYCTLLDEFGNQLGSVLATPGSSGQWVTVTFPFTVNVTAGSRYSIRLNDPLADGTFRMEWAYNSDNPYLNGSSSVTSTTDFLFSVDMDVVQASSLVLPVLAAVGGRLGVGTATPDPGFRFDVNGGIRCVSLTQTSDARFKRDVRPIGEALAKVQALRGVRYHWRRQEFPQRQFTDDEQLGFLAQELEQVLPQAVQKDAQGYYSVDYQKVVPVLTEAIKELQAKLEAAEQKLQQATADNATLRQQAATDRHRAEASAASVEARLRALEAGPAAQARR